MTNYETAEMIKYMNNCFFATKVSFMNEMKLVAEKCNVDWETAVEGFVSDGRIGHSHIQVPGPDGKNGFGVMLDDLAAAFYCYIVIDLNYFIN